MSRTSRIPPSCTTKEHRPTPWDPGDLAWRYPLAHERLAELYELKGNRERASYHAAKFVAFWEKADPDLQPRVQAKRTLLQRLSPDR
jgi:hypothetical protein